MREDGFEPSGYTNNPEIRFAKSVLDYVFRWLASRFLSEEDQARFGVNKDEETTSMAEGASMADPADSSLLVSFRVLIWAAMIFMESEICCN